MKTLDWFSAVEGQHPRFRFCMASGGIYIYVRIEFRLQKVKQSSRKRLVTRGDRLLQWPGSDRVGLGFSRETAIITSIRIILEKIYNSYIVVLV